MNQLTIRGLDSELERSIRKLAARERISLSQAALRLLRRGAESYEDPHGGDVVGGSLDHLIGTWSADDAVEFDDALRDLSHIDKAIWA